MPHPHVLLDLLGLLKERSAGRRHRRRQRHGRDGGYVVQVIDAVSKFVPKSNIVGYPPIGHGADAADIAEAKLICLGAGAKLAPKR
jgi:hypothetical protein